MKNFHRYVSTRPFSWFATMTLLVLGLIITGCGSSSSTAAITADDLLAQIPYPNTGDAQASTTFIGKVAGSEYFIGLVIQGDTAVGYLCDGQADAWLKGTVKGDQVSLSSASGVALTATLSGSTVTGKVTPAGGSALDFTASPPQGDDGLYRAAVYASEEEGYVGGWVYIGDDVRGIFGRVKQRIKDRRGDRGGAAGEESAQCGAYHDQYFSANNGRECTSGDCSAEDLEWMEDQATTAIGEAIGAGCDVTNFSEQP